MLRSTYKVMKYFVSFCAVTIVASATAADTDRNSILSTRCTQKLLVNNIVNRRRASFCNLGESVYI